MLGLIDEIKFTAQRGRRKVRADFGKEHGEIEERRGQRRMAKPFLEQFAVAQRLRGAVFDFLAGHVLRKTRQQLRERSGDFIREQCAAFGGGVRLVVFIARSLIPADGFALKQADLQFAERVRAKNFCFQIRQRREAVVVRGVVGIELLIHQQRNEKPELGQQHGERLDVHAVNGVLDEAELARVIVRVALEFLLGIFAELRVRDAADLPVQPAFVARVHAPENVHHAMQRAHRKRARTARRVKDADGVEGFDNPFGEAGVLGGVKFVVVDEFGERGDFISARAALPAKAFEV